MINNDVASFMLSSVPRLTFSNDSRKRFNNIYNTQLNVLKEPILMAQILNAPIILK